MRNRMLFLGMTVLLSVFLAAGCARNRQMTQSEKDQLGTIEAKIAKAEKMDAKECAPVEYAYALAERDNAIHESTEPWNDPPKYVAKHFASANKAADDLLNKTTPCWEAKQVKAPPPPPPVAAPPPPPPPMAPVATILADPKYVYEGKCTTLTWSTQNATSAEIDQGIGSVGLSGTKEVCPKETMKYTITATNPGGPAKAVVEVPVFHRTTLYVNFETNSAVIRDKGQKELQTAVDFVKRYPDTKIVVTGHTDSTGSDAYNQKLSEKRADAVKKFLLDSGHVKADMIKSEGRGETEPIADNKTKEGRAKNRRVEISEQGK
jgi:outer membrane protein OmpA-like peptidoglycan-associated protein